MNNKKSIKVLISGGGTGGHIFPAVAIANALKRIDKDIDILFVGAEGRMEMEKIPAAGYKIVGLPIMGFPRKPSLKMLTFFIKLMKSMRKAKRIVKDFKPDIGVGVGGYASGPALKAVSNRKIPYILQEQNSYPGITNKILGKKANKVFVSYEKMERFFDKEKIIISGNPIRQDIKNPNINTDDAYNFFSLNKNKPTILVTGGSLGALTINESTKNGLETIISNDIQLIWQTGKNYIETARDKTNKINSPNIYVSDFIFKMDLAYHVADVIIARAGASTISELCYVGKPVILVPSPNVAEDHQTKNAMALVEKNAAILVKDSDAREVLINEVIELISNQDKKETLSQNIIKLSKTDAADNIAKHIISLIK